MTHPKEYKLARRSSPDSRVYQKVTAADANWTHLNFEARLMQEGETWSGDTGANEYVFVLLSGNYSVTTNRGSWKTINGRKGVFSGIAHTLYLPRHTSFSLVAESEWLDIAAGWCPSAHDFPARFKKPEEVAIEIRGGDNATRQINSLAEPGFGCSNIVAVEVYTPSGNWSSFPAHKHDERKLAPDGTLIEAALEEFYFYKIDQEQGYAIQQVYTEDGSLNELMQLRNNDIVMVPRGYHPVVAGHGYNCYYLNFLAGSDQSLANTPDPVHEWIFNSWKGKDPRIPMVTAEMNKQ
ncbi:5-deoxy-glucuronate isomerase [Chitinophagaceae bacterium LB-8]|uniref:5-deoxy-glucuronate isomerase n=1 Tax=Paraflavisolibacter caeni TaxID=2982496 RepID=A0A9X2XUQ2_9BACT|nr:5-deoxy-glucuronate isomerase [Paraflavisolibacter caeni]MCU7549431.1 5-deoxy-glucuronate isomerase [Paraflavisolibacter caeni]